MRTELKERCERFTRWLENERGLRPLTARGYAGYVARYLTWAKTLSPPASAAEGYRAGLLERALRPSTLRNALFAVERYHDYLGTPTTLRKPKQRRPLPGFLSTEQAQALLFACDNVRDYALLNVLLYGALRASEAVGLDVTDWNAQEATLTVRDGKGGKPRVVLLSPKACAALNDWTARRPTGDGPLFLSRRGSRLGRDDVTRVVRRWATRAGISGRVTAHMLRHTFATHALRNGLPLTDLQAQLGHSDAKTTLIYTHLVEAGRRAAYNQHAPAF
jgi:site-specific recombinase XerD